MLLQTGAGNLLTDALYSAVIEPEALKAAESTAKVLIDTFISFGTYILSIVFTIEIARSSLLNERLDGMKLVRSLLTLLVFVNYNEVIGNLNQLLSGVFSSLPPVSTKQLVKDNPPFEFSIFSLSNLLSSNLCMTLAWMIQMVVLFLRKVLILFLYAAGPIALLVSMIPSFGDGILKAWLKNYVAVQSWALTVFILNTLFLFYANNTKSANGSVEFVYIAFMICYLLIPTLTNKYMGSAHANGLMSKVVGATTGLILMSSKIVSTITKGSQALSAAASKPPDLSAPMKPVSSNAHGAPQFESKGRSGFGAASSRRRTAEN